MLDTCTAVFVYYANYKTFTIFEIGKGKIKLNINSFSNIFFLQPTESFCTFLGGAYTYSETTASVSRLRYACGGFFQPLWIFKMVNTWDAATEYLSY